jgi:hypothetical protein
VGKEAVVAVVGALVALGLVVAGIAHHGADGVREGQPRAEFAGGSEGAVAGAPARKRARRTGAAPRQPTASTRAPGLTVSIRSGRTVVLHDRPDGRALVKVGARTPFGSPTALAVVRRRPGWLGVLSSQLTNGSVGWIRDDATALARTGIRTRLIVDRSARRLTLVRAGRAVLSVPVGVGRPGSETPTGTFAVTDRLDGARYAPAYGCCVLALTGRQPNLPPGWRGGDRLAIHGAPGAAARVRSAGCVAVDEAPLRRLMQAVPLGTLVTIRA